MADSNLEQYAERRKLRPGTVARIRKLGEDSSSAVLELAAPLAMNDNNLRETLDLLEDIAARRQCDVASVLQDEALVALRRRDMGRSDRIREIKSCLRRLRYPQLTATLARIDELRCGLGLPVGASLELPENLEGDELTVTLRAASPRQLRDRLAALGRAFDRSEIDVIFSLWQESEE